VDVGEGGELDGVAADRGGAAVDYEGGEALVEAEGGGHGGKGESCAFYLGVNSG